MKNWQLKMVIKVNTSWAQSDFSFNLLFKQGNYKISFRP